MDLWGRILSCAAALTFVAVMGADFSSGLALAKEGGREKKANEEVKEPAAKPAISALTNKASIHAREAATKRNQVGDLKRKAQELAEAAKKAQKDGKTEEFRLKSNGAFMAWQEARTAAMEAREAADEAGKVLDEANNLDPKASEEEIQNINVIYISAADEARYAETLAEDAKAAFKMCCS